MVRLATRADIPALMRVRYAVTENRLVSRTISDEEVADAIERAGRGWVMEDDGEVVAFSIGNSQTGNIWALFVDPRYEGRGYGRRLHDEMVSWLWSCGLQRLWLTTDRGTRAERFYRKAGWAPCGREPNGEIRFELTPPALAGHGNT